ncbi:hypothetical protein [Enterococcus olivae]
MKKVNLTFLCLSLIKLIYNFLPLLLIRLVDNEKFLTFLHYSLSTEMIPYDITALILYYGSFSVCLIYTIVKKNTAAFIYLWLTLIGYLALNYLFGMGSFLYPV